MSNEEDKKQDASRTSAKKRIRHQYSDFIQSEGFEDASNKQGTSDAGDAPEYNVKPPKAVKRGKPSL